MTDARPHSPAMATNGMVATPHPLATGAGMATLRNGGSAFDAAVAANAVLTVVYPDQTAIGGDCFFLSYQAGPGTLTGYNGSGRAPIAVDLDEMRALDGGTMPRRGIHAVTVPGTVDAWYAGHARFGRLPMDHLLAAAIGYAEDGFPVSRRLAGGIAGVAPLLRAAGEGGVPYLPGGEPPAAGTVLRLPALARSLRLITGEGRDAFYSGSIAERIAATAAGLGGRLSMLDLVGHRGEWVAPLSTTYRDATVATMPPNGQGITTLLALNMLRDVDLGQDWGTADHLHPLIEATRLAYATRDRTVTDPRFVPIDTAALLSADAARAAWSRYDSAAALPGTAAGAGDTVAICVVDRDGNAVSMIQSIFQGFGSGVIVGDTGIVLQNRGASFSLDPDHPNVIAPEKRPLHTLMPSMLFRGGALLGPLATQGGDAQAQIQLQIITGLFDFDMLGSPVAAIDAPRWLATAGEGDGHSLVVLEDRFPPGTVSALTTRGHRTKAIPAWSSSTGHAQLILRDSAGVLFGAADARADGLALGY